MKKSKLFWFLFLGFSILTVNAQQASIATGGTALGSGGTIAYSIGQTVFTTATGSNGSVAAGVQQPYEVSIILGISNPNVNLSLSVYPNPTTNFLTLTIERIELSPFDFKLFDVTEKLIEKRKITSTSEIIQMENLPSGIYFLNVFNSNKTVKIFKIIKN